MMKIIRGIRILLESQLIYYIKKPQKFVSFLMLIFLYFIGFKTLATETYFLAPKNSVLLSNIITLILIIVLALAFLMIYSILNSIKYYMLEVVPQFWGILHEGHLKDIFITISLYNYLKFAISLLFISLIFRPVSSNLLIIFLAKIIILTLILPTIVLIYPYHLSQRKSLLLLPLTVFLGVILTTIINTIKVQNWFVSNLITELFISSKPNSYIIIKELTKILLFTFLIIASLLPIGKSTTSVVKTNYVQQKPKLRKRNIVKSFFNKVYITLYKGLINTWDFKNKFLQTTIFFLLALSYKYSLVIKTMLECIFLYLFTTFSALLLKTTLNLEALIIATGYLNYKITNLLFPSTIGFLLTIIGRRKIKNSIRILVLSFLTNTTLLSLLFMGLSIILNIAFFKHNINFSLIYFPLIIFLNSISTMCGIFTSNPKKGNAYSINSEIGISPLLFMVFIWTCIAPVLMLQKLIEFYPITASSIAVMLSIIGIEIAVYIVYKKIFVTK